jgi:hypothetical protein
VPAAEAPVAHLATPQWQSFEIRMRGRKAERCLQRAAAALDDGSIVEATDALDEARRLSPSNPLLEELTLRLDALKQPVPLVSTRDSGYRWTAAAIVAGLGVFTSVGWQGWSHRDQLALLFPNAHTEMDASTGLANPTPVGIPASGAGGSATNPSSESASSSSDAIVQTTLIRPDEVIDTRASASDSRPSNESTSVATTGNSTPIDTQVNTARTIGAPRPPELLARPQREPATAPAVDLRTPAALPAAQPAAVSSFIPAVVPSETSRAATPASNSSTTAMSDAMPAVNTPSGSSTASASAPAATPAPLRDERIAIRTALNRYEAAYNRLDVEAVHSVWPSLDQRALARAFDSLTAQRVSLQNCNVDVSGSTAQANCSGSAAWTPKIGGGERTATRKWTFNLNESDGAWRIVHVQAR